jgi:hypothetical protein
MSVFLITWVVAAPSHQKHDSALRSTFIRRSAIQEGWLATRIEVSVWGSSHPLCAVWKRSASSAISFGKKIGWLVELEGGGGCREQSTVVRASQHTSSVAATTINMNSLLERPISGLASNRTLLSSKTLVCEIKIYIVLIPILKKTFGKSFRWCGLSSKARLRRASYILHICRKVSDIVFRN